MFRRRKYLLSIFLGAFSLYMLLWCMTPVWRPEWTNDAAQLIDLQNFEYYMQQRRCASNIEALIVVPSAPSSRHNRDIIRNTWGGSMLQNTPLRLIFLMGIVDSHQYLELINEQMLHGDLLQGSFVDHYRNETYKHVMALKWFVQHCARAQLLIKVDDDKYVNTPLLLQYLQQVRQTKPIESNATHQANSVVAQLLFGRPRELLLCGLKPYELVIRHMGHKWFVNRREFRDPHYPPHCAGYAIIYSADVVARLYAAAQRTKFFWIDHVHVTGTLAHSCGIDITPWYLHKLHEDECMQLCSSAGYRPFPFYYTTDPVQVLALWKLYLDSQNILAIRIKMPERFENSCGFININPNIT